MYILNSIQVITVSIYDIIIGPFPLFKRDLKTALPSARTLAHWIGWTTRQLIQLMLPITFMHAGEDNNTDKAEKKRSWV
jgi:hypothetical protein